MDQTLRSLFYTLHHSIYVKTNVPGPQFRALPLFYQCNGYKKRRPSQTTFTIPQCFFQCMLNPAKTVRFSCHTIKHNGRWVFSWIYALERTLRMDPISFITWKLDARANRCPPRSYLWDYQLYIKTSFTVLPLHYVLCYQLCFSSTKAWDLVCATEATALQKNRSTVSLTQEVSTSLKSVRNISVQAVQLPELMKWSSTSATGHFQSQF